MASLKYYHAAQIYADPLVLYVPPWTVVCGENGADPHPALLALRHKAIVWLVLNAWSCENNEQLAHAKAQFSMLRDVAPRHRFIFLANTYKEHQELPKLGVECLFAPHNQFVSPAAFYPSTPIHARKFSAVYNAAFEPYKRHELLRLTENTVLVGRGYTKEIGRRLQQTIPAVTLVNQTKPDYHWFDQDEINAVYNTARCGVALSDEEGAMLVAMEYLLAGLPVVTTVNRGGRDYYLDGRFSLHVADKPADIRDAVETFVKEQIPPEVIREETIRKLMLSRVKFSQDLAKLLNIQPESVLANVQANSAKKLRLESLLPEQFMEKFG